jgi:hypothetical protein
MLPLIIMKHKECKEQFRFKSMPKMISKSIVCAIAQLKSSGCGVRLYEFCYDTIRIGYVRVGQVRLGQDRSG